MSSIKSGSGVKGTSTRNSKRPDVSSQSRRESDGPVRKDDAESTGQRRGGRDDEINPILQQAESSQASGKPRAASLTPSEIMSSNIKKMVAYNKNLPLEAPKRSVKTVARRYLSAGASKLFPQKAKTIEYDDVYQRFIEQDKLRTKQISTKGLGLSALQVSGLLSLKSALMKDLAEAFPGRDKVSISEIRPSIVKMLVERGRHQEVLSILSEGSSCRVFLKNEDGIKSKQTLSQSTFRPVKMQDMTGREEVSQSVDTRSKSETVKVTPALAIALSCLAAREFLIFAKAIAVSPHKLLGEVDRLSFAGNIFSETALLALLRELCPADQKNILLLEEGKFAADGIALAINHYYRFSPRKGLVRHLPPLVRAARKAGKDEDLLIQNHFQFLAEVGSLVNKIISEESEASSEAARTEGAAAQAALLIGNTFNYAVRFTIDLNKTKRKVAGQIATVSDVVKGAVGVAGSAAPSSAPVTDAATLATGLISEMIESWALRSDQELNIEETAKQLARLSDGLKERSKRGLLVPGRPEWTLEQWYDARDEGESRAEETDERIFLGGIFEQNYSKHLANFKQRFLERTLNQAADQ